VLAIVPNPGAAVLLRRDGKRRVMRGVPLQSSQINPDQMQAWTYDNIHFVSSYATDAAIRENSQPANE
jgi:hypothetical protein